MLGQGKVRRSATSADDADMSIEGTGGKDEEDETEPNDGDTTAVKERVRQTDTQEYEGEEEERREMIKEEPGRQRTIQTPEILVKITGHVCFD